MIQTRRDGLFDPNIKIERVRLGYFYLEYVREVCKIEKYLLQWFFVPYLI